MLLERFLLNTLSRLYKICFDYGKKKDSKGFISFLVSQNTIINFLSKMEFDKKGCENISSYFGDMVRRLSEKGYREGLISVTN